MLVHAGCSGPRMVLRRHRHQHTDLCFVYVCSPVPHVTVRDRKEERWLAPQLHMKKHCEKHPS